MNPLKQHNASAVQTQEGPSNGSEVLLAVRNLCKDFGALRAVNDVSLDVRRGQIFAVIGPNGAGKTTLFNVVTGVYPATSGEVVFCGNSTLGLPDYKLADLGIGRTYQLVRLFKDMAVLENVQIGTHCRTKSGTFDALFNTQRERREESWSRERSLELLRFVGLQEYYWCLARQLSYGDQRRLEVARALATQPKLLLLDEPTAGMNQSEKEKMMSLIKALRDSGVTIVLIEHDMNVVMGLSDRILVLDHGVMIAEGTPREIRSDETVIEAYLGKGFRREPTANR